MSEQSEAKRAGAKLHRNSGRGWIEKGDANLGPFLVDFKEANKSFTLNRAVWAKVQTDALRMRMIPTLGVALGETEAEKVRLWVLSDTMFKEMLEAWEEKYGETTT